MRGMAKQLPYKEIFKEAKADIVRLSERSGKIFIPITQSESNILSLIR